MIKDLVCINCPHCNVSHDFERIFCNVSNMRIPIELGSEHIENKFCFIRVIAQKNLNSPHYKQDDVVELNDGTKVEITLVRGYSFKFEEYHYSGIKYLGNNCFGGSSIDFKHSDIKRLLTREELYGN